ncbi:MAG: glycosyltransferase [Alphaproteobacteria bacterium]|nr:glycosyltransferase [Alphaproteobacteria bacterium]
MSSTVLPPRRRILYIRHRRTIEISDAFALNQDEWVEALRFHADVTLINEDFDMDAVCDRVRPDFILYESPFFFAAPLTIQNVRAHPQIPRLAFQMQDPYCSIRVKFLRTMEALGIPYVFTHMTEAALRQSPEFADRTFSVSLLFDDKLFHDYGMEKDIPVSVLGGFLLPELYSWRAATARALPERFPTLIYTHPGYHNPVPRHKFPIVGESFARMINRSHFSLADSTHFDCLVRKHLEIPAAGSILIAPEANVLKPYGFRDMENCILGEGDVLFDKMAKVADDPALYEHIRRNGYDLVHARYTRQKWRGILDFYECLRALKPGETVRQQGILGPFVAMPASSAPRNAIVADIPDSEISRTFKRWMSCILDPDGPSRAAAELADAPGWLFHMVEPALLMGILMLLKGDIAHAKRLFLQPQEVRQSQSGFPEYDPEEIAWLSLIAALTGDAALLDLTRKESAAMRHLSLRRMQWLGKVLASGGNAANPPTNILRRADTDQLSIHWSGQLDIAQWTALIARILTANGQGGLLKK